MLELPHEIACKMRPPTVLGLPMRLLPGSSPRCFCKVLRKPALHLPQMFAECVWQGQKTWEILQFQYGWIFEKSSPRKCRLHVHAPSNPRYDILHDVYRVVEVSEVSILTKCKALMNLFMKGNSNEPMIPPSDCLIKSFFQRRIEGGHRSYSQRPGQTSSMTHLNTYGSRQLRIRQLLGFRETIDK